MPRASARGLDAGVSRLLPLLSIRRQVPATLDALVAALRRTRSPRREQD